MRINDIIIYLGTIYPLCAPLCVPIIRLCTTDPLSIIYHLPMHHGSFIHHLSSICVLSIPYLSPIIIYLCTIYPLPITYHHLPVYHLSSILHLSSVTYPLSSGANIGMCVYISPHTLISYLCFL